MKKKLILFAVCFASIVLLLAMCDTWGRSESRQYVRSSDVPSVPRPSGSATVEVDTSAVPVPSKMHASYKETFCDTNDLQLTAAIANGIDPVTTLGSAYNTKQPIVLVTSCNDYQIDSLTHSLPYLVPKAQRLLADIGKAFADTVRARSGMEYRVKVTSLLRSDYHVAKLKKRNRAATTQSCHRYGTTFDISWKNFYSVDPNRTVIPAGLKGVLAEIVMAKREQGLCYAIYETKQGCFHITVR